MPDLSYSDYLRLDVLLSAQQPLSDPPEHDEMLFIIQHQTTELWLRLMIHELRSAREMLRQDDLAQALKRTARVKQIEVAMTEQWAVLGTLTPSDYTRIRPFLATSSGFQSAQYREVEFLFGNKSAAAVKRQAHDPEAQARLQRLLDEPSLYDEFLRFLARTGLPVPGDVLDRDWSQPYRSHPAVMEMFLEVYEGVQSEPERYWRAYEAAEELVDVEDTFQQWRFRHLQVVKRIIGEKPGTGGSDGVGYLRRALDITFFPELFEVRTHIGA